MKLKKQRARPGELVAVGLAEMAVACRKAREQIDIATPFLSAEVAAYLVRACDAGRARTRRFITAMNVAAVEGGYLDTDAVEELVSAGFEARSLRNLHAKVLIVDSSWALVGSGNLTAAGSNGGNAELGIVLTPEQSVTAQRDHFNVWWSHAEPLDRNWMRRLSRDVPSSPQRRRRRTGYGGLLPVSGEVDLGRFSANDRHSGYWLKILYGSEEHRTARHWQRRRWISDRHTTRADGTPGRRPSYRIGEHLVIYLSRAPRQACPAIMRVVREPKYEPALVEREVGAEEAALRAWVTWVDPVVSVALNRAPTLSDIGVSPQSIRRHGHRRLTRAQYRRALRKIRGW